MVAIIEIHIFNIKNISLINKEKRMEFPKESRTFFLNFKDISYSLYVW